MPYQSAGCCYTHFPLDVTRNEFDLKNWNYNDDSDLSLFIIPNNFIDTIKDEYNLMTERQKHQILKASPHARFDARSE